MNILELIKSEDEKTVINKIINLVQKFFGI